MSLIYEPKGKAREYSPLALNIYSGGCDHGCNYCYCQKFERGWNLEPRRRDLSGLTKEAVRAKRQVLLSFVSDPYNKFDEQHQDTRGCLEILKAARCSTAILTKGGTRCLRDMDVFQGWPDNRVKVGATLTFTENASIDHYEVGSAYFANRLEALRILHESGIKTWVSIEPVIDPAQSLEAIHQSLPYVDAYKVGKLNHAESQTDWQAFCMSAVEMIRSAGKTLYVKNDLRPFAPAGFLTDAEGNCETVFLPDKPNKQQGLF